MKLPIFKNQQFAIILVILIPIAYVLGTMYGIPINVFDSYEDCVIKELYAMDSASEIGALKQRSLEEALALSHNEKDRIVTKLQIVSDDIKLSEFSGDAFKLATNIKTALNRCE